MNVEVGSYSQPDKVGYSGWVRFSEAVAFEKLDGQIVVINNDGGR